MSNIFILSDEFIDFLFYFSYVAILYCVKVRSAFSKPVGHMFYQGPDFEVPSSIYCLLVTHEKKHTGGETNIFLYHDKITYMKKVYIIFRIDI